MKSMILISPLLISLLAILQHCSSLLSVDDYAICDFAESITSTPLPTGWNCTGSTNVCNGSLSDWEGINCVGNRVVGISLAYIGISGTISSSLGTLDQLTTLELQHNNFSGTIPSSIGLLSNIMQIKLNNNILTGEIPSTIGFLTNLVNCTMEMNYLVGTIPTTIGNLRSLQYLKLTENGLELLDYKLSFYFIDRDGNYFTGPFPSSISFLTNLEYLYINGNSFSGSIPSSISQMSNLIGAYLYQNNLMGSIPTTIGYLTNLKYFYVNLNRLSGTIPDTLGTCQSVIEICLENNVLTGSLPDTLTELKDTLTLLRVGYNFLSGTISTAIMTLHNLIEFGIFTNTISGTIPTSIGQLTSLTYLNIGWNNFYGSLPSTFGLLTNLIYFINYHNRFTGTIPTVIGNLHSLTQTIFSTNLMTGSIPSTMLMLTNLQYFYISDNRFSSSIPSFLGLMKALNDIQIDNNLFTGPIPSSFGLLTNLRNLYSDHNKLSGQLPSELGHLESLIFFFSQYNRYTGTIPSSFVKMTSLEYLSLFYNKLTGTIPQNIGNIKSLANLALDHNSLTGVIPNSIGEITAMTRFILSSNSLHGTIPESIGNLTSINCIYLSNNDLTGTIPESIDNLLLLTVLDLHTNEMTGRIPSTIIKLTLLTEVYLHNNQFIGRLNSHFNSSNLFQLANIDVSNNRLTGYIPSSIFSINSLKIFAATGNCFEIEIPDQICEAVKLEILALDGLHTATTCRRRFSHNTEAYQLKKLSLRSVPRCLYEMPELSVLHLSGNALIGSIPKDIKIGSKLSDLTLSYNRFTGLIPDAIQLHNWTILDLSYNSFSGVLSSNIDVSESTSIKLRINRLSGDIPNPLRDVKEIAILEGNIFNCNFNTKVLPSSDSKSKSYRCGSDNLYLSLYVTFGIFSFFMTILAILSWREKFSFVKWLMDIVTYIKSNHRNGSMKVVLNLSVMFYVMSAYILFVVMPVYGALSKHYSTHTHQYAWTVSAGFLHSKAATATLLGTWIGMLLVYYIVYRIYFGARKKSTEIFDINSNDQAGVIVNRRESLFGIFVMSMLMILNVAVVFVINAAYVYTISGAKSDTAILLQILVGVFKVFWREHFVNNIRKFREVLTGNKDRHKHEILFIVVIMIVNNVVLPVLAEAAIDPNCLYNTFVAPSLVTGSYSYDTCLQLEEGVCYDTVVSDTKVSYVPPFIYRYQCSAIMITNYSSVFVFMFLFVAIQLALSLAMSKIRNLFPIGSLSYRSLNVIVNDVHRDPPRFRLSLYIAGMLSNVAILVTFGAAFPPLAVVIIIAITVDVCLTIHHIKENLPTLHHEVATTVVSVVWSLIPFSAIFFIFFLYDTAGQQRLLWNSFWAPTALLIVPIVLYLITMLERRLSNQTIQKASSGKYGESNGGDCNQDNLEFDKIVVDVSDDTDNRLKNRPSDQELLESNVDGEEEGKGKEEVEEGEIDLVLYTSIRKESAGGVTGEKGSNNNEDDDEEEEDDEEKRFRRENNDSIRKL